MKTANVVPRSRERSVTNNCIGGCQGKPGTKERPGGLELLLHRWLLAAKTGTWRAVVHCSTLSDYIYAGGLYRPAARADMFE